LRRAGLVSLDVLVEIERIVARRLFADDFLSLLDG
jgi:hypothetical protein